MEYMLLIHADPEVMQSMRDAERSTTLAAYGTYTEALRKAGVMKEGNRLRTADTATTVKVRDGRTEVLNGPFVDIREQLGGYYVIEAESLAEAQRIAAKIPAARFGSIEVRPVVQMPARA